MCAATALKSRQSLQKAVADSMDVDVLVTTDGSMDLKVQDALLGLDINLMHTNLTVHHNMFLGIRQRDPDPTLWGCPDVPKASGRRHQGRGLVSHRV